MHIALERVQVPHSAYGGVFPARMAYLHPEAARAFREGIGARVVCSDMFRSPEASLLARRTKRGVQRPGFSAHNYGLAIDIDVDKSMRLCGLKSKTALDAYMAVNGWVCHRLDGARGSEDWHFNYMSMSDVRVGDVSSAPAIERRMRALYAGGWDMSDKDVQIALFGLGLYGGAIDNRLGPLSTEAARAFCRAWDVLWTDVRSPMFRRTLACVGASRGP